MDDVSVWFVDEIPARIVWEGVRYRVNDQPTKLSPSDLMAVCWHPAITHPPRAWVGWRFQGVDPSGLARVFDIRRGETESAWRVVKVYD